MKIVNVVFNNFLNDSRVLKTSNSLLQLGNEVLVVAVHADKLKEYELVSGVPVHRIKLVTKVWFKLRLIQIFNLFEFVIRFVFQYRNADIVHCNDLAGLLVGVFAKVTKPKLILVYDSHEFAINQVPYQSKISIWLYKVLESILIKYSQKVINVSNSIASEYSRLYSISKPHLVLNCPPYSEPPKQNLFRKNLGINEDQTVFLYQGRLSKDRNIEMLVEAFSEQKSDKNVLVCMGYGPLESFIKKKAQQQNNVFFHSAVNPDVLLKFTTSADYGILFYEDSCLNHRYCLPNKLFEYLMAGLPVLTSNLSEIKRLVETERVGIVAKENTVEGFRKAVQTSLQQNYTAIQQNVFASRKKYCWEQQEKVLKKIYDDIS